MQSNPGHFIRRANRSQILALLAVRAQSRAELCAATGLTGAAISRITRELIDAGLVEETLGAQQRRSVGRRSSVLTIAAQGAYVLAVTLSANRLEVALYDARRHQIGMHNVAACRADKPRSVIHKLIKSAQALVVESGINPQRILGVGISVAVNAADAITEDGRITSAPLGWEKVAVKHPFENALSVPVTIQPRAMSLLCAEMSNGCPIDRTSVVLINIGVGVGSARLARADSFRFAGELVGLAHVAHPTSTIECSCGRLGCLEYCASGVSIVTDLYARHVGKHAPFVDLGPWLAKAHARAASGDNLARTAFYEAGKRMATGVDIIQAMINPDRVLLAGSTGRQPDYVAGVACGWRELQSPFQPDQLGISKMTSSDAAAGSALQQFLFSDQGRFPELLQLQDSTADEELAS